MKELIKQLRDLADNTVLTKVFKTCTAAADTIEDLQAKLDRIPEKAPDKWDLEMMLQAARAELKEVEALREAELNTAKELSDSNLAMQQELNDLRKRLKEVETTWEKDYANMRKFQAKFIVADQERRELERELADEKYRHDRLQDFEVAESEQIARLKAQLSASFDREIKLKKELERKTTVGFFIGAGR